MGLQQPSLARGAEPLALTMIPTLPDLLLAPPASDLMIHCGSVSLIPSVIQPAFVRHLLHPTFAGAWMHQHTAPCPHGAYSTLREKNNKEDKEVNCIVC